MKTILRLLSFVSAALFMSCCLASAAPGDVDLGFGPSLMSGTSVGAAYTTTVQPDGKIIIGGIFSSVDGVALAQGNLVRLNAAGSLDLTFNANFTIRPNSFFLQNDGKVIIGTYSGNADGEAGSAIKRINSDGSLDLSFKVMSIRGNGTDPYLYNVSNIIEQNDGKTIIGGRFCFVNGIARSGLARLNPDGSLDP